MLFALNMQASWKRGSTSRSDWLWHIEYWLTSGYVSEFKSLGSGAGAYQLGEGASGHLTSRDSVDTDCFWVSTYPIRSVARLTCFLIGQPVWPPLFPNDSIRPAFGKSPW
jgi:hypothetical protein